MAVPCTAYESNSRTLIKKTRSIAPQKGKLPAEDGKAQSKCKRGTAASNNRESL